MGLGATGSRVAQRLRGDGRTVRGNDATGADVVVLCVPVGQHHAMARDAVTSGAHVVSISDDLDEVGALLELDGLARRHDRAVAVGAGFAPGMSCLLARHAADLLDEVVEIAVTKAGTAGPACARQHHRAMKLDAVVWIDGEWVPRRGGSGRDLVWFPPPIGARDAYRAALPSPRLLQRQFPSAQRISARVTATRRDRLTSRLPMLRPPHADGGPGAIRVEVRGRRAGEFETVVYAAMHHPSTAAAIVSSTVAARIDELERPAGAFGLAEIARPLDVLRPLHDAGLGWSAFVGSSALADQAS